MTVTVYPKRNGVSAGSAVDVPNVTVYSGRSGTPGTAESSLVLYPKRNGGAAAAFTPSALFGASDKGLYYDFTDMSSLRQDAAGTVPVTLAGQSVGFALDKSGKGNNATGPTAKGTYNATTGLVCAGAGNINTASIFDATFNNSATFMAVMRSGVPHTDLRLVHGRFAPNLYTGYDGSNGNWDHTTGFTGAALGANMATDGVLALEYGVAQVGVGLDRFWLQNGTAPKSSTFSKMRRDSGVGGNLGFSTPTYMTIGGADAAYFWPGQIGAYFAINRLLTTAEYKALQAYFIAQHNLHPKKLFVCCGNSQTSGQGSTGGAGQDQSPTGNNMPARVWNALAATWDVRIDAYPGRNLTQMTAESPLCADVMGAKAGVRKVALVWETTNTLMANTNAAATLALLQSYCAARRAAGFSVLVGTCLNRGDGYGAFNTDRLAVNASILANFSNYADGVVDFAAITELQTISNATYFNVDQIHLTDAGYQKAADAVTGKVTALGW